MKLISSLQQVAGAMQSSVNNGFSASSPAISVIDRLFADDALRASFEASNREEQDRILGIK
jgi:hypothetical protein